MNKEVISEKQGISLLVLFIVGGSSIFAQALSADRNVWLAYILAILTGFPLMLVYARLHCIFPGKNFLDIIEICFGSIISKIIILIYIWISIFIAGDIVVIYSQFINLISFPETPQIITKLSLIILCILGAKKGIEVLGRSSRLFLIVLLIYLVAIVVFLIPEMDIEKLKPILYEGAKPVFMGTLSVLAFPIMQIVIFTMTFSTFSKKTSPYKIYILGMLIGIGYLAILSTNNILVWGLNVTESYYYPLYTTIAGINISNLGQRIELGIIIIFFLGGFIKISILIVSACKGVGKIFNFKDYKIIIIPIALLVTNLSHIQYKSVMYYYEFNREVWPYYHLPFQIFLPLIIWIIAEIKKKRAKLIQ
ncbi:GerAB/ArcD/ProY family transporter [Dethiothermospora halolimnae]|uniref:GerAB/ArcD/ProY family transporter n=1 Tax=Dethiothermospora halolimnae TaxID=3114390 RepID=UPI003CCC216F